MNILKIVAVLTFALASSLSVPVFAEELYDDGSEQAKAYDAFLAKVMKECGPKASYALKLQMVATENAAMFQSENLRDTEVGHKLQEGAFNDFLRILTACPDTANHRQSNGITPLIETAAMNSRIGYLMSAALIDVGADVNAVDEEGHSVLYAAVFAGNFLLVRELSFNSAIHLDEEILATARKFADPKYGESLIAMKKAMGDKDGALALQQIFAPKTQDARNRIVKVLEGMMP